MNERLIFNGSLSRSLFYLFLINVFIGVLALFVRLNFYTALTLFVVVNIYYLVTIAAQPYKIIIDKDKFLIEIHYLFSTRGAHLCEVECSYNYEILARGGKAKMLKITRLNKSMVKLFSHYNGWSENDLIMICEQLNELKKLNYAPNNKTNSSPKV